MNLTLNQFEVLTYIDKKQDDKITQRDISKNCRLSLGNVILAEKVKLRFRLPIHISPTKQKVT